MGVAQHVGPFALRDAYAHWRCPSLASVGNSVTFNKTLAQSQECYVSQLGVQDAGENVHILVHVCALGLGIYLMQPLRSGMNVAKSTDQLGKDTASMRTVWA